MTSCMRRKLEFDYQESRQRKPPKSFPRPHRRSALRPCNTETNGSVSNISRIWDFRLSFRRSSIDLSRDLDGAGNKGKNHSVLGCGTRITWSYTSIVQDAHFWSLRSCSCYRPCYGRCPRCPRCRTCCDSGSGSCCPRYCRPCYGRCETLLNLMARWINWITAEYRPPMRSFGSLTTNNSFF